MLESDLSSSFKLITYVYEEFDLSFWTVNPIGTDLVLPCLAVMKILQKKDSLC